MRIFVTGGLGVVGSNVARNYLEAGHDVLILDSAQEQRNAWVKERLENEFPGKVTFWIARMEDVSLDYECEYNDVIVHCAAHTGIPHSIVDPNDDWSSNAEATRNLMESMRKTGTTAPVVALSSVKPYSTKSLTYKETDQRYDPDNVAGIDENCPLDPDEPYAASKMAQSAIVTAYARSYGIRAMTLRCSNMYGPSPCHGPRHGWLTWFCIAAAIGAPIEVQGSGKQTRDMLYVSDVVDAINASISNINVMQGNVYNVGGGYINSVSVIEAVNTLKSFAKIDVDAGPGRILEDPVFVTDSSRFQCATGWSPRVHVFDGMKMTYDWALRNRDELRRVYESCCTV